MVSLDQGAAQAFAAHVTGAELTVAWSLAEGASGGTIGPGGAYVAPMAAGDYHVVARAGALTATATVHVARLAISLAPSQGQLMPGRSLQLLAMVSGAADRGVLWSMQEGAQAGSIDAAGLYVAPPAPGLYHAIAASRADPSITASASISVVPAPLVTVSIDPKAVALEPEASARFTATVMGASDAAVSWSADSGSVDPNGVYVAPSIRGSYHVTATSRADPTKSATAEVQVDSGVSVVIVPGAVRVEEGAQQQLAASVAGLDKRVTGRSPKAPPPAAWTRAASTPRRARAAPSMSSPPASPIPPAAASPWWWWRSPRSRSRSLPSRSP